MSRALLRLVLAGYTQASAAEIQFRYGPQGKPAIACPGSPQLRFNVSHSGKAILLAFALDRDVGVDVERTREDVDFAALAEMSFSHRERNAILAVAPDRRASLFYEYWTCKEACIKADGRGLSVPLDRFSIVNSTRGSDWREVALAEPAVFEVAWHIRRVEAGSHYAAAVAAAQSGWELMKIGVGELESRD